MSLVGRENVYTCQKCGGFTVTVDVDDGVTPMFMGCRAKKNCDGYAGSAMYPPGPRPQHVPAPAWEWYRPAPEALSGLTVSERDHVEGGGLLLRRRVATP